MNRLSFWVLLSLLLRIVSSQALHEPVRPIFGAWLQAENHEKPAEFNRRIGQNAGIFQIAQDIPLSPYNWVTGAGGGADEWSIELSGTDASVLLTVYMTDMNNITDQDLTDLGNQMKNWTDTYNRQVFLRWGPEMQGTWNPYGFQPATYVDLWRRMYPAIKEIAPDVAIVWAPNMGQNYPYGQTIPATAAQADITALDTNEDGVVDELDDPYSPYYPGDEYVDWVGLSLYYKGSQFQNANDPNPAGYCAMGITGYNLNDLTPDYIPNWYDRYCHLEGKACMIAESGSAYHVDEPDSGVTHLEMARSWWEACITNTTFLDQYPRLKMIINFEYEKEEQDGGVSDLRDYRLTNDTDLMTNFAADLSLVADSFEWAQSREIPSPTHTDGGGGSGGGGDSGDGDQADKPHIIFQTGRNSNYGPPTLFSAADILSPSILIGVISTTIGCIIGVTSLLMR